LLLYFVLTKFDESFKQDYAVCWFPFTSGEMKDFKSITLSLF